MVITLHYVEDHTTFIHYLILITNAHFSVEFRPWRGWHVEF